MIYDDVLISAAQRRDSVMHIYIYIPFYILSHYGLSQDIECRSLRYPVGLWCLAVLYVLICIANPKLPPHPSPTSPAISNHESVLYVCESVSAL